jgi:hypothetical protein
MPSAREPPAESRDPWCRGSGETTAEASTRREHRSGTACCCRPRRPRSTAAESMIDPRRRSRQQPQPRARRRLPRAARQLRGLRVGAVQVLLNRRVRGEECRTKPVIDGRRPAHGGPANRARRTVARRTVARPTVAWNGCLANGIRRTVSGERYPANGARRMARGEPLAASRAQRTHGVVLRSAVFRHHGFTPDAERCDCLCTARFEGVQRTTMRTLCGWLMQRSRRQHALTR